MVHFGGLHRIAPALIMGMMMNRRITGTGAEMGRVRSTTDEEKQRRREMILEAAEKRFRRFGYSKTTMEEIAGDAGISKGTIYIYFKNKEEIFTELLDKETLELERLMYGRIKNMQSVAEQLKTIFIGTLDYLQQHPFLYSTLRRDVEMVSPRILRHTFKIEDRYVSVIEDYVRRGIETGEIEKYNPHLTAYILYKIFEAFSYGSSISEDDYSREEIETLIPELIRKALLPAPGKKKSKAAQK
ncbi:MAG: hypothetical protein A2V52_01765 [Actinobacteria bacterium RBG_19FT_COMBO_54_7]|uniref:HTH tetR-type domain-containing protein n=1 Tax=Candidatus Solincola sediminis TaxID=1797199 RepID=A0A1F2WSD5_9ACTN|nr:MAG: hypothetical protein A2Y75_07970 [Candidatus Solincola sediminis]OFW60627.1 MAG: hypothetical protein A2W01_07580 [Candidatus Solincola sediminis]OFW67813.1 MAG: hypothetical protein A2V52_01765 [Actinobacteria bacterium RBG_19FT_COMBO_54_7]